MRRRRTGSALAISDAEDRILATSPYDADAAHVFAFDGTQWAPSVTFRGSGGSGLGINASFAGEDFVAGAWQDGLGGAVYVGPTSDAIFADGFE
jgi:hypothetical protein